MKANVQSVPKVNGKGRVQKNVVVKTNTNLKGGRGARGLKGDRTNFNISADAVPIDATAAPVMNNGGAVAPPQVLA